MKTGKKIMSKGEDLIDKITGDKVVLDNLEALYIKELNDIYDAETQIIEAMPLMIKTANNPVLKKELENHLAQTRGQRERLVSVLELVGEKPNPKTCHGMKGILKEGEEMMKQDASPAVKDAALIAAASKVEHYEMASYESVVAYAQLLNETDAQKILSEIQREEVSTASKLSRLAIQDLNVKAVEGV